MKYVVGHINQFDSDLILEEVTASSLHEAFWGHSKMKSDDWNDMKEDTKDMDAEQLQQWSFDFDMNVAVLELS